MKTLKNMSVILCLMLVLSLLSSITTFAAWSGNKYKNNDGTYASGLTTIDGKLYYFNTLTNKKVTTKKVTVNNDIYYFNEDGTAVISKWLNLNGNNYYFGADGKMVRDTWVDRYYVDYNGICYDSSLTVAPAPLSNKGTKIAKYAQKFVGNPYVYGGTSLTKGADCSGFVMSVFAHYKIKLMRVANDQMKGPSASYIKLGYQKGEKVKLKDIQPGDLLFYGSKKYAGHVALYIGNHKIVHASDETTGIIISNYNYRTPVKAMRYWA